MKSSRGGEGTEERMGEKRRGLGVGEGWEKDKY